MSRIITVFILLVSFGSAHPVFAVEWLKKLFNSEKAITAHITLVNKCDWIQSTRRYLNTKNLQHFRSIAKVRNNNKCSTAIQSIVFLISAKETHNGSIAEIGIWFN